MANFVSTYWIWLLFLGAMLFMHLGHRGHSGHGGGGGCGGGHGGHADHTSRDAATQNGPQDSAAVPVPDENTPAGHHVG